MTLRPSLLHLELVEDRLCLWITRLCKPLRAEPRVDLVEAVVRIEDATNDELRRHRSVPVVLLKAEGNVVTALTPVAVELRPLPEGDRTSGVVSVALNAEAQMLPVADGSELAELAARRQQRDIGVGQPERRQRAQLFAELQRQLRAPRQDRVDDGCRDEVFRGQQTFGSSRERLGERLDPVGGNRQARGRPMSAEPPEAGRAGTKCTMEVERRDRASGAFPEA